MDLIMKFACDEAGAAALEYSIILALLGVGLIGSIGFLGTTLRTVFEDLKF
jgi:pilus assembly protein Flp/PilA